MSTTDLTRIIASACLLLACDDLELEDEVDQQLDAAVAMVGTARSLTIDASGDDAWVYLDLESGSAQKLSDPAALPTWDLAFSRFKVKLNGGVSGTGGALTRVVEQTSFAEVTSAPDGGYLADGPDGSDTDLEPDYVISTGASAWYDYDTSTHLLSPKANVYVIKSVEGGFFKLALLGYYNEAGSSGYPRVQWESIAPAASVSVLDAGSVAPDATTSATKSMNEKVYGWREVRPL